MENKSFIDAIRSVAAKEPVIQPSDQSSLLLAKEIQSLLLVVKDDKLKSAEKMIGFQDILVRIFDTLLKRL